VSFPDLSKLQPLIECHLNRFHVALIFLQVPNVQSGNLDYWDKT